MAKEETKKSVLHPNLLNIRVSNDNVGTLDELGPMVKQSNMTKNEYLETVIIQHIQAGKVLNKVAV